MLEKNLFWKTFLQVRKEGRKGEREGVTERDVHKLRSHFYCAEPLHNPVHNAKSLNNYSSILISVVRGLNDSDKQQLSLISVGIYLG